MNFKSHYQKKRFGQHWLVNKKILEKIKEVAELNANDFILEIGPGRGALTSKLLDSEIRKLHAIELDYDLIDFLNLKFKNNDKFSLQQGDILSTNLDSFNNKITKVVANIPYNITGPILDIFVGRLGLIRDYNYKKIIFLMQKDVVDRILAKEGSSSAGALSVRMQLLSKIKKICDEFNVPLKAAALQFGLNHPSVASTIPGPRNPEEIVENLEMLSFKIDPKLWVDLQENKLIP